MRVLAVTTWFPTPSHPSVGAFVVKDASAIATLGHDVHIVHLAPAHQLSADGSDLGRHQVSGLPVTRVPMSTSNPVQIAAARRTLTGYAQHADLIHTMAFSALLPTPGWRPGVPWVHTEHWSGLTAPQTLPVSWRAALPALEPLLRGPHVVTAVCDYLADPIRQTRADRPTTVVPCIVPRPDPVPERPSGPGLSLVSVGALVERKDPVLAVDILNHLLDRGHEASLTLVGQGDLEQAIREHAADLGISDRVRLTGVIDGDGVRSELARADLFLGPTRGDNFFVSCAEAIVSGRPVVVGSTGGQGEYIHPDVGETVDVQDARLYADAVEGVLDRSSGLSAQDIADTIGDRFEPDTVAQGYQDAYDLAAQLTAGRTR